MYRMYLRVCFIFQLSVFVHIPHSISAKYRCRPANTWINVKDRNENTHKYMHVQGIREREDRRESALSHLWICHIATTVSVTFAKARNKMCVGMCVIICIGCLAVSVHMFRVCPDLLWSDQYYCLQLLLQGVRPCLFPPPPPFPPVCLPHHMIFVLV